MTITRFENILDRAATAALLALGLTAAIAMATLGA
jgi:hypothetical protein